MTELPPQPDTVLGPPPPGTPKKKWPRSTKIAIAIIGSVIVLGIIGALATQQPSTTNDEQTDGAPGDDALVQRTCEIFRDIAGDYSDGVDTLQESRDRLRDLLNGYGQAAPNDISDPLQAIVAGLTQGDIDAATDGIRNLGSACSARGY